MSKSKIDFQQVREQVKLLNDLCIWSRKASLNENNINLLKARELSSDVFNLEKMLKKQEEYLNHPFESLYRTIRTKKYLVLLLEHDMKPTNIRETLKKRLLLSGKKEDEIDYHVDLQAKLRKEIEAEVKGLNDELNQEYSKIVPLLSERLKYLFTVIINEESSNGVDMSMVNNAISMAEKVDKGKISADAGMEQGFKYTEDKYNLPKNFFEPMKKEYESFKKKGT